MTELMDELRPIADIIGESAVKAEYSDTQLVGRNGDYAPGWLVTVHGTYEGAKISFSNKARTLSDAAGASFRQLNEALGLS